MKELIEIQAKLKAPKNQRNNFGKYNYRSAEDILEALKPLLSEYKCFVTLSDDLREVGDRVYIKATATITNAEGLSVNTIAYAKEPLTQKGMSETQITGSASSYARKYALNGLFAIDDNKDDDTRDNTTPPKQNNEGLLRDKLLKYDKTLKNEDWNSFKKYVDTVLANGEWVGEKLYNVLVLKDDKFQEQYNKWSQS